MDTRDGTILTPEQVAARPVACGQHVMPMGLPPTPGQRAAGKIRRIDPCPCGSGS